MKGHIRERSPGHWAIVIDTRDASGKRKRKWHSFRGNKRAAQVEAAKLISEAARGTALDPEKVTVREFLDRWLEHMSTQVSPRTIEIYRENVQFLILPALGNALLSKLKPDQIAKAYSEALQSGRKRGGGLSPRSVGMMHRTLSQALKQAVTWNLLATNPAASCKPPRIERKEMKVHDVGTTAKLIEYAKGGRLYMPIVLFALCGLRRAEVAAIRWSRLALDAASLSVSTSIEQTARGTREKPPKSGRGRTVAIPSLVVEELRRHRLQQAQELLRLGIRQTDETHVCLREDGSPWPPRLLTNSFVRLIKSSGLPRIRLHDLRHSHATHLLATGVHPKVVQERLGHASIQLTLDTYSHVMPSMQDGAAATIDAAMRKAMKKR
jgi:integrase